MLMLLALLVGATSSVSTAGIHDYDPWCDFDDDGDIDIFDIVEIANRYGTTGVPVNKTALLYNVTDTFHVLLDKIEALNLTVTAQQTTINNLNNTVIYLNQTLHILNGTGFGIPDYDSDWVPMVKGQSIMFTHNLNTNASELLVHMLGRYYSYHTEQWYTHQWYVGGDQYLDPLGADHLAGVMWDSSDNNTIRVNNLARAYDGNYWEYVRVLIWKSLNHRTRASSFSRFSHNGDNARLFLWH
jgi:hypothetical protein